MKKCDKHPKYNGKKQPKHQCLGCLSLYFSLHSAPRAPHRPTKQIRSSKTYNRKTKHRKAANDES